MKSRYSPLGLPNRVNPFRCVSLLIKRKLHLFVFELLYILKDRHKNKIHSNRLEKVADWHVGDSLWITSKVLHMIEKHRLFPNSVYDVGCGAGEIPVELQKKMNAGVELCSFDISHQAISISKPKENGKLKFYNEDFLTAVISPPDLLLLLDAVEHISDYVGFLNILRKKSDWIIFHIPLDICAKAVLKKSNYLLYMRQK